MQMGTVGPETGPARIVAVLSDLRDEDSFRFTFGRSGGSHLRADRHWTLRRSKRTYLGFFINVPAERYSEMEALVISPSVATRRHYCDMPRDLPRRAL